MSRIIEIWGDKNFTVEIPDDARVTFGPWAPPTAAAVASGSWGGAGAAKARGTIRVYKGAKSTENILAVFTGVEGFRDMSIDIGTGMGGVARMPSSVIGGAARSISFSQMKKAEKELLAKMVRDAVLTKVAGPEPEEDSSGFTFIEEDDDDS